MKSKPGHIVILHREIHKAWLMLIGCCFLSAGSLGAILGSSGVFFAPVCEELGFLRSEFSTWITAYFLSMIVAMPVAGHIITKFDVRIVMGVSASACALAAGLMGTYDHLWQFIASGLVFGVFGTCVFQMPTATILGNWFDRKAGLAMGLATAFASLCTAFFSPFYQLMISMHGWRVAYFIQGFLVALMTLPWIIVVLRLRPSDVGALPYGFDPETINVEKKTLLVTGVPCRRALLSIPFIMVFIFAGIGAIIGSGFDAHLPGFALSIGFDPAFGAFLVSALQIGSVSEKLLMGYFNDKFGVQRTVYIEFVIVVVGLIVLISASSKPLLLVGAFLFGVQDSFTSVSLPLLIKKYFGKLEYEKIYSWARVGSGIFGAFAAVLVGLSFDLTASYTPAFLIAIALCVVGALLVTIAGKLSKTLLWEKEEVLL